MFRRRRPVFTSSTMIWLQVPGSVVRSIQQFWVLRLWIQEANALVVLVKEFDLLDWICIGQPLMDAPAEERLRYCNVLVHGCFLDLIDLKTVQFHLFNVCRGDLLEGSPGTECFLKNRETVFNIRGERTMMRLRVFSVSSDGVPQGDPIRF